MPVVEVGPLQREGDLKVEAGLAAAGQKARRAGHNDLRFRPPVFHLSEDQPVCVGVGVDSPDFADDDFRRVPREFGPWQAEIGDLLHFQSGQRKPLRQLGDGEGDFHIVLQPG